MTKLRLVASGAVVAAVSGLLMWSAAATPLTGAGNSLSRSEGALPVVKTGCMFGTTRCPKHTKWSCSRYPSPMGTGKKCVCRSC
jgi:hypothetical protein